MGALQGTTEASHTRETVLFTHLQNLESTLKPDGWSITREEKAFPYRSFFQLQTWKGQRSNQTSRWRRRGSKDGDRSQASPTVAARLEADPSQGRELRLFFSCFLLNYSLHIEKWTNRE